MIKISVCVITYNHSDYIADCLHGIFSQKGNFQLEVVIRDDKSSDGTYELCCELLKQYSNNNVQVKLLPAEENLGANKNILKVLSHCTGDFVAFCEGDDYWCDERKLEVQLEAAINNPACDFFVHPAYYLYSDGRVEKKQWPIQQKINPQQKDIFYCDWQFAPTASYFIRRKALTSLPLWFADASIGDIYLEIYCSVNGIHVTHCYSSVYRYLANGSWSLSLKNDTNRINRGVAHYLNFNENLQRIKKDFSYLSEAIDNKLSANYFQLALLYAKKNDYANLRSYLKMAHVNDKHNSKSLKKSLLYFFKNSPMIIKILIKLNEISK